MLKSDKFKIWLKAALIRAVKTMAQTAVAMIATSVVIKDVDWLQLLSASVLAGIVSILTSIGGLPEVDFIVNKKDNEIFIENIDDMEV